MRGMPLALLAFMILPDLAWAEPGGGGDLDRVRREVETMRQDGRWDRLLAESRANKQAFEGQRQAEQSARSATATGSIRSRPRQ